MFLAFALATRHNTSFINHLLSTGELQGMKYKAVLFDLDGTLLDTLTDIANAMNVVLSRRCLPVHDAETYRGMVGEGAARLVRRALPQSRMDDALVQSCLDSYLTEYRRTWNCTTKPYEGIPELLDSLAKSHVKLTVFSNKPDSFTQLCVKELLPKWRFASVIGSRTGLPLKPDPEGALETATNAGIPAKEFIYLGDSGVDMQTAIAAKMYPVGALWGFRSQAELEKAKARAVVKHPSELIALLD